MRPVAVMGHSGGDLQVAIGAALGGNVDALHALGCLGLLFGVVEVGERFDHREFHLGAVPAFHRQVAIRTIQVDRAPRLERHVLGISYLNQFLVSACAKQRRRDRRRSREA